jgi:hypothetical protein
MYWILLLLSGLLSFNDLRYLGNDSWVVREQATKNLIQRGMVVIPSVWKAIGDPDPEIAKRADLIFTAVLNRWDGVRQGWEVYRFVVYTATQGNWGEAQEALNNFQASEPDAWEILLSLMPDSPGYQGESDGGISPWTLWTLQHEWGIPDE